MAAAFHFLRPEWLLALVPAAVLAALAFRAMRRGTTDWSRVVDPHLLTHLVAGGGAGGGLGRAPGRWPVALLLAGWIVAVIAMAGPTWEKLPQPTAGQLDPVVVALSLSPSMNAPDASPSRLAAARYKVADVLARMRGGEVGLVVFADIPFTASPLTADGRVVGLMLPDLATDLMRGTSNRPDLAIDKAVDLLKGAGATSGRILLVTDGPGDAPGKDIAAAKAAAAQGYRVSVIGVGRPEPGPGGNPAAALGAVAAAGQGAYSPLTADDRDLDRTLPADGSPAAGPVNTADGFRADVWADAGPLVLLVALLLAPLAFRRGWIAVLALAAVSGAMAPRPAAAGVWDDLWWRPDQQGAAAFAAQDYTAAARSFEDPKWRAAAQYRAGDAAAAANAYARLPGNDYNRGNALARADRLEEAVAAYDAALAAAPDDADARFNRDLVQGIIDARKKKDEEKKKDPPGLGGGGGGGGGGAGGGGQQGGQDQRKDAPPKSDPAKPDPSKPDPNKNDPSKNDPGKPDQQAGGGGAPSAPQPTAPLPPRRPPEIGPSAQQPQQPPPQQPQSQPQQPPPQPPQSQPQPPQQQDQSPPQPPPQAQQPPPQPDPAQRATTPPPAPPAAPPLVPPSLPQGLPGQPSGPDNPDAAFEPPPDAKSNVAPPQPPQPTPPRLSKPASGQDLSDDAQSREQALRQVLDDPGGLLRARIRAHYSGAPARVGEEETQ